MCLYIKKTKMKIIHRILNILPQIHSWGMAAKMVNVNIFSLIYIFNFVGQHINMQMFKMYNINQLQKSKNKLKQNPFQNPYM